MGTRLMGGMSAAFVLVVAAACSGGSSTSTTGPSTAGGGPTAPPAAGAGPTSAVGGATCNTSAAASGPTINATGSHSLDVPDQTIQVGGSVTWSNSSNTNHEITFSGGPDCGILLVNKSYSVTFSTPGTYSYVCKIHPTYMKGTITVQ